MSLYKYSIELYLSFSSSLGNIVPYSSLFLLISKKDFNKRGKNPPFKKGGKNSSLFKARCFECNSTDHLLADCPKAIEKEKGALEEKLEALKKKKKGKGLIGAWDQDTSESEGDEKANM
ncbi:hypothetical protein M9H77_12617 [Catharanthus roseus]|uniref:Uncharacterized protein n=1 Tax=Catharanthus roseus TaxID=4058 RepID=A0ACC0BI28_CATRO|nr:hypothetical protein M9H77_12617 [Catharanthus roseus]